MWIRWISGSSVRWAWIQDRDTLGSARSNSLVLASKEIRPLHGQFLLDSTEVQFRDFLGKKTFNIALGESFYIGSWRLELLSRLRDDESVIQSIQDHFQIYVQAQLSDQQDSKLLRARFLREIFLNTSPIDEVSSWIQQMQSEISLESPVEKLLEDPRITDVLINSYKEIFIEKDGRLLASGYRFSSRESYEIYVQNLLSLYELQHSPSRAQHNFQTLKGVRVHVIGPPLTNGEFYMSFRKFPEHSWTLAELLERDFLDPRQADLLEAAVQQGQNILISGPTGSGKTTLLKALLLEVPLSQRILLLEDTPEIQIKRPNLLSLRCRSSIESEAIDLKDLLRNALRMRPDRIVLGEVRGEEAFYLLMALNTGHAGSVSTLHANSARDALWRLQSLVRLHKQALSEEAVRDLSSRNIQIIVQVGREQGKRKLLDIQRVRGIEGQQFLLEAAVA